MPAIAAGQTTRQSIAKPEVTTLTITGVTSFRQSDLVQNLAIAQSHCRSVAFTPLCLIRQSPLFYQREYLDHDELARDVIRARVFYYQRGYQEATVDTVVRPAGKNAVRVIFAVHEGPPLIVSSVHVTQTIPALSRHDVASRITVRIGKPLNVFDLDSTRSQLRERLLDKGFARRER